METSILFPSDPDKISEKDMLSLHPFSTFNSSTSRRRDVYAIVAMAPGNVIGKEGGLPWHLPEDLRHFKATTMGHPVIMGRKTWESLPKRPLPGRRNIVVSRNPDFHAEGAEVFSSIEAAIEACDEIPFIIGGAEIYRASLPYLTKLYLTVVGTEVEGADAFFPKLDDWEWRVLEKSDLFRSENGLTYFFITKARR